MDTKQWDDMEAKQFVKISKIFWVLVVIAATVFLYFLPRLASSQEKVPPMIAFLGDNSLTLYQDECPLGGWFKEWKKAEWMWQGQTVASCWTISQTQGGYFVSTVDALGAPGMLPVEMFAPKGSEGEVKKQKENKRGKGLIQV